MSWTSWNTCRICRQPVMVDASGKAVPHYPRYGGRAGQLCRGSNQTATEDRP